MKTYAHIHNNEIVNIFEWDEEQYPQKPDLGNKNVIIDITNIKEKPQIGWIYQPNKEEIFIPKKEIEEEEEEKTREEILEIKIEGIIAKYLAQALFNIVTEIKEVI